MAKAKKKAKAKAKAKKIKKAKKVSKKVVKKKVAKKKPVAKKKKVSKKVASKKSIRTKKKSVKKTAKKKISSKKKESKKIVAKKEEKVVKPIQQAKSIIASKPIPVEKPEKEKKKTKEEIAEEREALQDEGYSWENQLVDMRQYEPAPVYRKPDPPQPKFKGKKDNRSRYSDKELSEFKKIILEKITEAERDYELLKNTLAHRDEQGTDDTSPTFKVLEDGSDAMTREEIAQLASRQERHIQNLKNALVRIENKTYGICRATGKLIPKERLKSVPHATLSIEAKLMQSS